MKTNHRATRDAETALPAFDGRQTRIDRRTVLRAGGVSIALPFLEAMRPRKALAQEAVKKRFIAFFSPNGVPMRNWSPTGGETDFQLSPILSPLEPLRQKVIVLRGVDQKSGGAGDGHQNGMTGMLTGQVTNPGPFRGGCGQGGGWANGISVDQHIANVIGKTTKFKSLELGVVTSSTDIAANFNRMSYAGPNMPLPPEENPASTFNRLFADLSVGGGGGGDSGAIDRLRGQRQTILNAVLDQYRYIKGSIGAEDGRKIESHFQAIREIETRLGVPAAAGPSGGGGGGGVCAKPELRRAGHEPQGLRGDAPHRQDADGHAGDGLRLRPQPGVDHRVQQVGRRHHHELAGGQPEPPRHLARWRQRRGGARQADEDQQLVRHPVLLPGLAGWTASPSPAAAPSSTTRSCSGATSSARATPTAPTTRPTSLAGSGGGYFKTGRFLQYSGARPTTTCSSR